MAEIVITSSVLILVIAAVRHFLRGEFPLRLQYGMWALAALRLLAPVTFIASSFSVLNAVPAVELPDRGSVYLSDQGITAQEPPPRIVTNAMDHTVQYAWYYAPGDNEPSSFQADEPLPDWAANYTTVPASRILPTPKGVLTAVWYIGMAAMGGWFLWVNVSFRTRLRAGRRRAEVPDCPLPVYVAEDIPSPCLVGLFRPAIYITPGCLEDEGRLRHVLAHELTHWRHKDPLWSLVRCVCLTVYWFHPLVWLAASLSRRDCELACDEGALARLGEEERIAYGRTLIGLMAVSASPARLLQTATTMVDGKRGLKERLNLIVQKPRVLAATAVAAVLIAGVAVACTFTGAVNPTDSPEALYATVEEALADIPEELSPTGEENFFSGVTAFTPEHNSDELLGFMPTLKEGELFRGHLRAAVMYSSSLTAPLGWMASVFRMDQAAYDALVEAQGQTGTRDAYWECFAKDSEFYYLIHAPLKAPELKTGETEGAELREKLVAWLKETVLTTRGVTAFDGERFEYLHTWTPDPDDTEQDVTTHLTGWQGAFVRLLEGDNSLLADGPEAQAWLEYGYEHSQLNAELGFLYMEVDGDGDCELYLQNTLGPEVLNAVFDYRDGKIHCWRFDNMDGSEFQYPLTDRSMVYENHFGDAVTYRIFRYTRKGEEENLGSLVYTPAGGLSGDSGDPAIWQVDGVPTTEEAFNSALEERITGKLLTGYYESWELDRLHGNISVGPGDPDWPADPTPKALAWILLQKYYDAYTQVVPNSRFHLDFAEVIDVSVFDMDDLFAPTALACDFTVALGGKNLDDMGGWQAGPGMYYQTEGPYAGKWLFSSGSNAQERDGRWYFQGIGGGNALHDDGIFIPDLDSCQDDNLMSYLLKGADGAYAEAAQYELGERFLARPEDILSTMTWYRGIQPGNWPDDVWDGADWLATMLVSEFFYGDHHEAWEQFVDTLFRFDEEDFGGMARDVQKWYLENFVAESEPNGQP